MRHSPWTNEEIQTLRPLYPHSDINHLKGVLSNHTEGSIRKKANDLRIEKATLPWNKGLHGDPRILASLAIAKEAKRDHHRPMGFKIGHKPWTYGLTTETSPKLSAAIEKGAIKKRNVKQDPEIVKKRAESIQRHYVEHPEDRVKHRETGLRLAQSPYHHRRKHGEYTLPPESRRKISRTLIKTYKEYPEIKEAACRALEKGRLSMGLGKGPTEPERQVESLLKSLTIKAIPQYRFNGFFLDFALPEEKLAVLVDGCYWHCCPVHFPMAASKTQQHNLAVDKKRERILKRAGWHLIHIWEHELENIDAAKLRLKKEVIQCVSC